MYVSENISIIFRIVMNCVKDEKKNYVRNKFIEIDNVINNIDSFEK